MNDGGLMNRRGLTLKARHLILAAVLLAAGALSLHVAIHRHDGERRLEELRAAGYPTSFAVTR